MANSRERKWRSVALVLAGLVAGQILMGTAGAHIKSFKHLKAKHFFTKSQADTRFRTRWAFLELDASPRILKQTGGFSLTSAGAGFAYVNIGENGTTKGIQLTPEYTVAEANGGVCGGNTDLTITCVAPGTNTVNHIWVSLATSNGTAQSGKVWLALLPS